MKLVVAVLSYNPLTTGRAGMFRRCLESLNVGVPVIVVDNGSDDDVSPEMFRRLGAMRNQGLRTIGAGMNFAIGAAVAMRPDVVVFSNDDMEWHPGWADQVESFWSAAPEDIAMCTGLFERRLWSWNRPVRKAEWHGGVQVLERETVPAAGWTFRAGMWPAIRPVPQEDNSWGDVPVCGKLRAAGYRLVGADWASHLGDDVSLWGNKSHLHGEMLDLDEWGWVE